MGSPCPVWVALTAASSVASRPRSRSSTAGGFPVAARCCAAVSGPCRTWCPPEGCTDPGGRISPSVRFWFGDGSIDGVRTASASARSRASWNPTGTASGTYTCRPPLGLSSTITRPPAARTRSVTAAAVPPDRVRAAAGGVEIDDQHPGVAGGGVDRHRRRHRRQPRRERSFPPPQIRVTAGAGLPHPGTPRQQRRQHRPRLGGIRDG